jgi:zinc/manganese transport system permease protein
MLSIALLAGWPLLKRYFGPSGFYAAFALAVTASVQLVGVYLVFASLIVPALATHRLKRRRLPAAFAVGIAGYGTGLLLSIWFDLPAGAAIVWAMALCGLAAGVLKRAD